MKTLWISPSQLAFKFRECPRCTWLHFQKIQRPGGDFSEFNLMDREQKKALPIGTDLRPLGIPGCVSHNSKTACSVDLGWDGYEAYIFGEFDLLASLDGGGYAIVDLKSGRPKEEAAEKYSPQLSSYAYSLINPDRHHPMDIRAGYLIHCWPESATFLGEQSAMIMSWRMEATVVQIDISGVEKMVRELVEMAIAEKPPASGEQCPYCRHAKVLMGLARKESVPA